MSKSYSLSAMFTEISKDNQRRIISELTNRERSVLELCSSLKLNQPLVSKHLAALRKVNLVSSRKEGQRRLYRLNPTALKLVYDWIAPFEIFWDEGLEKIEISLQAKK